MDSKQRTWVWCSDCGRYGDFSFHTPDEVYCNDCGRKVGETTEDIQSEMAALKTYYQVVVDAESGKVLSGVEWDTDRVEVDDAGD